MILAPLLFDLYIWLKLRKAQMIILVQAPQVGISAAHWATPRRERESVPRPFQESYDCA